MKKTATSKARKSLAKNRRGATAMEYGMLAVAVTIATGATWRMGGDRLKAAANNTAAQL